MKPEKVINFLKNLLFLAYLCLYISCSSLSKKKSSFSSNYIYLSHTRLDTNDSIFKKIYKLNLNLYNMTLLGGDLGYETFEGSIIHHLDTIFDLKNKNTLWSIGNHDKTSDDNFKKITRKNKYHKYIRDNTTFIIINSQDSLSSIIGKQKDFLLDVLHKVNSKNIIVLSHKLIFMDQHPVLDSKINQICNGGKGNCYYCHNTNNFQSEIYPELVKIKKSGKTLIWIGGDLGYKTSKFEYIDKNGIIFLGNGFWYKNRKNKVLLFSNKDSQIKYRFIPIDTLIKYQSNKFMDSLSRAD